MKTSLITLMMAASLFAAVPNPSNGALDITAVSNGIIFNDTNPQHIDALVAVVDSEGKPVTGITTGLFMVTTQSTPPASNCGIGLLGATEKEPGFYMLSLAMGQPQCKWSKGDYLMRVGVFLGNAQGQTPLKVTVKLIPPNAVQ